LLRGQNQRLIPSEDAKARKTSKFSEESFPQSHRIDQGEVDRPGHPAFPSKMRPDPWGWSVYTSTHQSLSLNETGTTPSLSQSRTDLFFEILYFQEFGLSRPRIFFQKSTKHYQKMIGGRPAPLFTGLHPSHPPS